MNRDERSSSGSGAVVAILVVGLLLGVFCLGGLVVLGGAFFYVGASNRAPVAAPMVAPTATKQVRKEVYDPVNGLQTEVRTVPDDGTPSPLIVPAPPTRFSDNVPPPPLPPSTP